LQEIVRPGALAADEAEDLDREQAELIDGHDAESAPRYRPTFHSLP
jgi:hypothetical protein